LRRQARLCKDIGFECQDCESSLNFTSLPSRQWVSNANTKILLKLFYFLLIWLYIMIILNFCRVLERSVVTSRFIHELLACRKWASQPIEWWKPFFTTTQQAAIDIEPDKDFKWLAVPREIIVALLYKVNITLGLILKFYNDNIASIVYKIQNEY